MSFMPWVKAFEFGIQEIDEQHRALVEATNRVYEALMAAQPDQKLIGESLEELLDSTFDHFVDEESMFANIGYAETEEHLNEHNDFIRVSAELLKRYETGGEIGVESLQSIKDWLSHHILEVDRTYLPLLKEKDAPEER